MAASGRLLNVCTVVNTMRISGQVSVVLHIGKKMPETRTVEWFLSIGLVDLILSRWLSSTPAAPFPVRRGRLASAGFVLASLRDRYREMLAPAAMQGASIKNLISTTHRKISASALSVTAASDFLNSP